jgi:hypothetical protein
MTKAAAIPWLAAAALLAWCRPAAAEIVLGDFNGWEVFTDGRINAFGSYALGDRFPDPNPLPDGAVDLTPDGVPDQGPAVVQGPFGAGTNQEDAAGDIGAMRVRNGFVSNVLAFGFRKKLNATTTLRGYFALWSGIESEGGNSRLRNGRGWLDVRQGFLSVEGRWGGLLVGRNLGLFSRAAVEINYTYQHAYGLGHPCGIDGNGPTCGHIGFGVIYPGFDPGIVYATPDLGGLKLTVGLYDPVVLTAYMQRTPFPRPEAELAFDRKIGDLGMFKLFANALWQRLETSNGYYVSRLPDGTDVSAMMVGAKRDAWGVGGGGRLELGPMRFGATGFTGVGLGTHYPIQHSPGFLFNTDTFQLRKFDGFYGALAGVFGRVTVHTGFGIVLVHRMPADLFPENTDPASPFAKPANSIPEYQYGISGGIAIKVTDAFYWALDVFRQHSQWYTLQTQHATMGLITYGGEKQSLLFLNTGVTFIW